VSVAGVIEKEKPFVAPDYDPFERENIYGG
jgi:hypothetical protein